MNKDILSNISKIIERDSKSTTYKFALLRGIIDIIQDNSPFIEIRKDKVIIPVGLLIEKWLMYYYPILSSHINIPQINGNAQIAFHNQFLRIISHYDKHGGLSVFYNDLRNNGIPPEIKKAFVRLINKLKVTITDMPMKYIGGSITKGHYSIFKKEKPGKLIRQENIDTIYLINCSGKFSIPIDYYEAFKVLGSFLSGQDSILFKWADFSIKASGNTLTSERVVNEILKNPITEREINSSKIIYNSILKNNNDIECVWTGKRIGKYDIDHAIPFSVWKNNDLWNLFPTDKKANNQKRDKIPSPSLLKKRKEIILYYWDIISKSDSYRNRFNKELTSSLLGNNNFNNWENKAFINFKEKCKYLIENRGFEAWNV